MRKSVNTKWFRKVIEEDIDLEEEDVLYEDDEVTIEAENFKFIKNSVPSKIEYEKYTPKSIFDFLSKKIYGQNEAVKAASMLLFNHINGRKRNAVFVGPTGCGKTEIWKRLRELYPYIQIVDSTMITKEGWSGRFKIADIFKNIKYSDVEKSIIVFDEFDKFCEPTYDGHGVNYSYSIQNELLKLIEGDRISYSDERVRYNRTFDSSKVSFVFCGSFELLVNSKKNVLNRKSMGFGINQEACLEQGKDIYTTIITSEDLVKYSGMRQEIAGRINQIIQLSPMTEEDYKNILMDQEISPIKKIENQYDITLQIEDDTIDSIVKQAVENKMGVRYLQSKIQGLLDQEMFLDIGRKIYTLKG